MGILDQIANIGTAGRPGPIAAFLVGRENRRQIERQENRDAQLDTRFNQQAELTGLKIDQIKGEPERIRAQQEAAKQQSLVIARGIFENPNIPNEKKSMAIQMLMSGNENAAKEALDLIQDELKPNRTQRVEQRTGPIVNEKEINTDAIQSAQLSASLRRNLVSTLPDVLANKGSVGARGAVGLALGGATTAITGSESSGDAVSKFVAGASQEDISTMQARLKQVRSGLVPILSAENSTRISDQERKIASDVAGVIDEFGITDVARAYPQVIGALKELTLASLENEYEQALASPAVQFPFDLNTDSGIDAVLDVFDAAGYDDAGAERAIRRLMSIQNANR